MPRASPLVQFFKGAALFMTTSGVPQPKRSSLEQLARFENAEGLLAVAASPIGIYLDILWQGISLAQTSSLQDIAIVEHDTPDNFAA